jgi:putative methionine-R-sulfoxide reductase with GAF domain/CHASE3 domain sensor protein
VLKDRNEFVINRIDVNKRLAELDRTVNLMDLGLRGYFMMNKKGFQQPYTSALDIYKENLDTLKQVLDKLQYEHLDSIDYIKKQVANYADLVGQGIKLVEEGVPDGTIALFENDPGYDLWKSYSPTQRNILRFVRHAEEKSNAKYDVVMNYSFYAQLLTLILSIPILVFVVIRLNKSNRRINSLFAELDTSNQTYIYNDGKEKVNKLVGDILISNITDNLKRASSFIKDITKGNLDVAWNETSEDTIMASNQDTLVGELITMRNQMKDVKMQEERRYWIAEGISSFSEIIRDHQDDVKKLSERLVSEAVKYTKSTQGALFLINENDKENKYLELVGAYAYDRKKYMNKIIHIGEGMLGQVYLEGRTTLLAEVPKDYLNITSGLGRALPENVILVPLKVNEDIQGVLELASFNQYQDKHREFLEKIGEITASAAIHAKSATQTNQLLQLSRENEEQMRSQEEEMRQNMEELQATQEQEQRTRTDLEGRIMELEASLASK